MQNYKIQNKKISNTFNEQVIPGVAYASFAVCIIIMAQIVIRLTYKGIRLLMATKES